ncbi:hypothetical protein [Candidatus Ichthyocystis hellenicum]|uniref:hypothetical protein n=1 Tax=Candidatus Ichthyocystis hellenicum TaxID=1561003 RepID=UPI000B80C0A8|nr:hypothetical protein [Candidatus Ichthyocystis hellenicum]
MYYGSVKSANNVLNYGFSDSLLIDSLYDGNEKRNEHDGVGSGEIREITEERQCSSSRSLVFNSSPLLLLSALSSFAGLTLAEATSEDDQSGSVAQSTTSTTTMIDTSSAPYMNANNGTRSLSLDLVVAFVLLASFLCLLYLAIRSFLRRRGMVRANNQAVDEDRGIARARENLNNNGNNNGLVGEEEEDSSIEENDGGPAEEEDEDNGDPVLENLDLAADIGGDNDPVEEGNDNIIVEENVANPEPGIIEEDDNDDDDSAGDNGSEEEDNGNHPEEFGNNWGPVLENLDPAEGMEVGNDHVGENNNNPVVEHVADPEPVIIAEDDSDDDSVENGSDDSSIEDNDNLAGDVGNGGPVLVNLDLVAGIENNNDPVEEGAAGPEPDVIPELLFDFDRIIFVVRNLGRPDVVPDYVVRLNNNAPQVDEEPQINEEQQVVDEDVVLPDVIPH